MKNIKHISSLIAAFALLFSVSCEDNDLPDTGSIVDANPPEAAFFFTDSAESVLIKNLTNSSRRGSTQVNWTLPEGAEFTFNSQGVLTTSTDDEIVVMFPETIDDPNDPFAGYEVGIEAIDANGVSSGVVFFTVQVNLIEGIPVPTPLASIENGAANSERVFVNESANASGGVVWSVLQDGNELDIDTLLTTDNLNFIGQTNTSEEVLITFPRAGNYEVVVTAINFNGVRVSDTIPVTIDPIMEPVPSFKYSSNDDYSIQTLINTTPDTDSVLWTLPDGATLVGGTLTSEEIQVSFPSSGDFAINLEVTSVGVNEDDETVSFTSLDEVEMIVIPVVRSRAEIPEPVILGGGFERPIDDYLSPEGEARTQSDLGKEYWIPDGVSQRVFTPGTSEPFPAYPGETDANLETWFVPISLADFNRIGITSNSKTGESAAEWDSRTQLRAAVQRIEVMPGVDYKVTFWYENVENATNASLLALVLNERVVRETETDGAGTVINEGTGIEGNIIAQEVLNEQATGYIEASVSFNSGDQSAIKLYFNTSEFFGAYRLDDVTISID